jgi:hypothetical protein
MSKDKLRWDLKRAGVYATGADWMAFSTPILNPVFSSTIRGSVYQFNKTAANLLIECLFNAGSGHAFAKHQRIKLVFQSYPLIGHGLFHKVSNVHAE